MSAKTIIALALGLVALTGLTAGAKPTPVPGGANQVSALSAKVGQTVFNGMLRIQVTALREATAADHPEKLMAPAGQKVMIMTVLLKNGAHRDFVDLISYTLADADEVTFAIPPYMITPSNLNIQQGAAARQTAMFSVDPNFKPTKLLVQCPSCGHSEGFRPIRFTIP
jgi:lipopolysaccharide biosynthesis regulator YciM